MVVAANAALCLSIFSRGTEPPFCSTTHSSNCMYVGLAVAHELEHFVAVESESRRSSSGRIRRRSCRIRRPAIRRCASVNFAQSRGRWIAPSGPAVSELISGNDFGR